MATAHVLVNQYDVIGLNIDFEQVSYSCVARSEQGARQLAEGIGGLEEVFDVFTVVNSEYWAEVDDTEYHSESELDELARDLPF